MNNHVSTPNQSLDQYIVWQYWTISVAWEIIAVGMWKDFTEQYKTCNEPSFTLTKSC